MTDLLALPTDPLARTSLELVHATERREIAEHSVRSFLYARAFAAHEGSVTDAGYREDLLFAACILHDLGLGSSGRGRARFEVEGADLAAGLLREHGVADSDVERVWEAVALHSCLGLADRFGLLTSLTHRGVFTDAGRFTDLPDELRAPIRAAYPRATDDRSVREAIIAHAARSAAAAPPFSISAELLRQSREAMVNS